MFSHHVRTTIITALICLTPTVQSWDRAYIKDYLLPFTQFLEPQEISWFISEQITATNYEGIQEFMLEINAHLGLAQMVLTQRTDKYLIDTEMKKSILVIVFTTTPTDPIMRVHDRALFSRHYTFNLVIMVNEISDFAVVAHFLCDLKRRHFQKAILYYRSTNGTNEVFGYTLFPEFGIKNRSNYLSELSAEFEESKFGGMNTLGYKLRTPLRQDLPGVFHTPGEIGLSSWHGSTFSLLLVFTDFINATLVNYEMPKDSAGGELIDMKAALNLIRRDEITLLAHASGLFYEDDYISLSYPITVVRWCLMVPIWNSVSTMFYPLEPFDDLTWLGIVCVFGALLVVQCLWCCLQGTQQLSARLSDSILRSFCLSTGITAPTTTLGAPSVLDFLIFTTFFFYGFFLTASYTSLLGSILTVNLFRAQFNTMDDLIKANISVMIIDYELEFLLSGDEIPQNFSRLIKPVDIATFIEHQYNFNTSYAYFVTEEKWHFLDLQQQYHKPRFFKFSNICFGSFFLAFPMHRESFLHRSLEYYIFRMHSSGMLDHYERNTFDYAARAGLVKRLANNMNHTSAGMQHLVVVFLMLIAMFVVSFIVLLVECLSFRKVRDSALAA
ncbi:uncharacterized protein LOC128866900 [Anastrepha ludens]|nr:uncharacterized protein LOC128866900 [Anastrepha ludens]